MTYVDCPAGLKLADPARRNLRGRNTWNLAPLFPIRDDRRIGTVLPEANRESILGGVGELLAGESIVLFIDDTFWGDGRNGVMLTPRRLLFKAMAGDPVSDPYHTIEDVTWDADRDQFIFWVNRKDGAPSDSPSSISRSDKAYSAIFAHWWH